MRCDQYYGLNKWARTLVEEALHSDENFSPFQKTFLLVEQLQDDIVLENCPSDIEDKLLKFYRDFYEIYNNKPGWKESLESLKNKQNVIRYKEVEKIEGAWGDYVASLHRYIFPDGRIYQEYIQANPRSSDPCYFTALKDYKTGNIIKASLWTDEEIDLSI